MFARRGDFGNDNLEALSLRGCGREDIAPSTKHPNDTASVHNLPLDQGLYTTRHDVFMKFDLVSGLWEAADMKIPSHHCFVGGVR